MAPQYAYPDADVSDGSWQNESSNNTNLYASIDDAHDVADAVADNTYISVSDDGGGMGGPSALPVTVSLGSTTDPASGADHSVVILWSDGEGYGQVTLNVNLKDGSSSIKNEDFTVDTGSATPITSTMSLSTAQANNISSSGYGNLSLVLTSTDSGGSATTSVFRAYFKCPEAASSSTPIAAIAMNTYRQMRN
jgi:hypothetical protein